MTTDCKTCRGIRTVITQKFCRGCGEPLLELPEQATDVQIKHAAQFSPGSVTTAADAEQPDTMKNLRGPAGIIHEGVWNPATEMYDRAPATTEPFTPAQMVAAIDQWLAFGEDQLGSGHCGYFSGSGFAARALRAARDFIEKAGRA